MGGRYNLVDTSIDGLTQALSSFGVGTIGPKLYVIAIWTVWGLLGSAVVGVLYLFLVYRIRPTIFVVAGSGDKERPYTVSKKGFDFVRPNKDGSWSWLMNRKRDDKFNDKYVYPGRTVVAFKVGDKLFPGRVDFSGLSEPVITPVHYDVRRKVELEMQQIDIDLQKQDWWSQGGKQMIISFFFALLVIAFAFGVLWLAFAKTNTQIPAMDRLTGALQGFGTIK